MAVRFNGTNQALRAATQQLLLRPIHIGLWVRPGSTADQKAWCFCRGDAQLGGVFTLRIASGIWQFARYDRGTGVDEANPAIGPAAELDKWQFVLMSLLDSGGTTTVANLSVLSATGTVTSSGELGAGSGSFAMFDQFYFGSGASFVPNGHQDFFNGMIAEFWMAGGFQWGMSFAGSLSIPNAAQMRQLAYRGPFSDTRVRAGLLEYRAFRSSIRGTQNEIYLNNSFGTRVPVFEGTPIISQHPPLPANYGRLPRKLGIPPPGPGEPATGSTLWKPDTCSCVLEYWNSDETWKESHAACGLHAAFFGTPQHLTEVLAHNTSLNRILNEIRERFGLGTEVWGLYFDNFTRPMVRGLPRGFWAEAALLFPEITLRD